MISLLRKVDYCVELITSKLLVFTVISMLLLSVSSIVLRWMGISFLWLDPLVRHLVFICTFLGGVIATGRGTHIGIDIIGKQLEVRHLEHYQILINRVIYLASASILVWMIKAAIDFTKIEFEYGKEEFLGIHGGYLVSIIPIGFSVIALRYVFLFIFSFSGETAEAKEGGQ